MITVKDRYSLGIISGIVGNIIRNIFNYIGYLLNINKYMPHHIAAGTFLARTDIYSVSGLIIGITADYGVAIFFAITVIYLIYYTGNDYIWIKGISIGLLYWLFLFGMLLRFGLSRINPIDPPTNIVFLLNHILLGIIVVWIINRYGKEVIDTSSRNK